MKKMLLCSLVLVSVFANAQQTSTVKNIIPVPASVTEKPGTFILKNNFSISAPNDADAMNVAKQLSAALSAPTGYAGTIKNSGGNIQLQLLSATDNTIGNEGYKLSVTSKAVTISANKPAGLFYGMQTLLQLLPPSIESKTTVANTNWTIPCVEITDEPRFGWRGMMFDVSRHFFTKAEVKQFIDDMVKYKYNLLHWHLTDDEGWRIEIKSLPKLTEVGAWRVNREGKWANTGNPFPNEPKTYGGFYTQDDIKEVIQYAKERYVTILPEVDVPGHSLAALASYPELSCTPGPYEVSSGAPFMNWFNGGHEGLIDNTLCPANEKVYDFLDKVFTEVAQLFPFEYIHMGGDETAKNFWAKSDQIKALMQKENLKDMNEVQSYFVKRVEKIVESKGKKLIGWDEILEGGLAPSANVMSWRGMKGGITAAKMGHQVVMTPTDFVYMDYVQGEPSVEAPVYASLRLNKAYQFEPVPDGVDPKLILGGQANLWTEQIQRYRTVQYMMWPRSLATAECLWSPKEKKNWNDFANRVQNQFPRMDAAGIRYARSIYDPIIKVKDFKGSPEVSISTEIEGLDVYYSIDESIPDNYFPKYSKPIVMPADAEHLKVITYKNGKQVGQLISLSIDQLKSRERGED
ncbi:family 20 glycosylhydrolase [Panacibacter ginsenosidivorans]|uniref:beta-N-acetylhexosaminidase n=1 Tax=Panacibacter ginsenosidivorans TaxID=1813871 RepID=A0A5B8VA83_9BACT|nr:family 20 glycosylhydrolase [Panacibacter ginsenosidivorans]QEC68179.1 family 20 glycosylhydrolase [Panacibacter ginsenosidivorans]